MTERQRVEEAVKHLKDALHIEDRRPFWKRLLASLRVKVSGVPPNKIEVTGKADF